MKTCNDCIYMHTFPLFRDKRGAMHSCEIPKEKKRGRRLFVTGKEKACVDFKQREVLEEKKVYQCRYCTNSSNEGEGILMYSKYTKQTLWVCMPCYEAFREEKARAEGE